MKSTEVIFFIIFFIYICVKKQMAQYEHYQITTDGSEEFIPHIIDISACSTYRAEDCNCDDDDSSYSFHMYYYFSLLLFLFLLQRYYFYLICANILVTFLLFLYCSTLHNISCPRFIFFNLIVAIHNYIWFEFKS